MSTSVRSPRGIGIGRETAAPTAYAIGALLLLAEAAVHLQQFATLFHGVRWVGLLFVANAVSCLGVAAALVYRPTRRIAALGGIVVSALALGGLVVSYGHGLFGWQEAGFRTSVAVALAAEIGAIIALSIALAVEPRS